MNNLGFFFTWLITLILSEETADEFLLYSPVERYGNRFAYPRKNISISLYFLGKYVNGIYF